MFSSSEYYLFQAFTLVSEMGKFLGGKKEEKID